MLHMRVIQFIIQKIRHLFYLIWSHLWHKSVEPNLSISIDIVIPIVERDLEILPLCLEGLKRNVCHDIKDIYIVAPDNKLIKEFAKKHNLVFIEETTVLGYSPKDIHYIAPNGLNRGGWMFQQLLKLSGKIGSSRYFVVIDADHILLKPHVFITKDNSIVFYQSSEYHIPYYRNIKKILKFYPVSLFSYVSHKMIFDKEELAGLHAKIESLNNKNLSWDKVILSYLDDKELSCFSEFELYGNYVANHKKTLLPWREKTLPKNQLFNYEKLQQMNSQYLSVTFPSYLDIRYIHKKNT